MTFRKSLAAILLGAFCIGTVEAQEDDTETLNGAVQAAEQFILSNALSSERMCPDELRYQDNIGEFDLQPHCRIYTASEAEAFAVLETEIFWRVYFRKVPPSVTRGIESFRVVQVYRESLLADPPAHLHDIELDLDANAVILRKRVASDNNRMEPTRDE